MQPLFGEMFDQDRLKAAGEVWMKGLRDMQDSAAANTKARTDEVVDFWKAFFSVKSMDDVHQLQAHVAKSVENSMGDTKKATDSFKSLVESTTKTLKPGE